MKKICLALLFLLLPSASWAQCNGVFPNNTACGNVSGGSNIPRAIPLSSFPGIVPGGTTGQLQTNNGSGGFGAVPTPSGDCTFNTTTGVFVCTKTNSVLFGPYATASAITGSTQCVQANTSGVLSGVGFGCGPGAAPIAWRQNMGVVPVTASPTTQVFIVGPAFMVPCAGSAWIVSTWQANPDCLTLNNIGQGGFGTVAIQNFLDITNYNGSNCVSPCVSKVGASFAGSVTAATPAVVTWTAHGFTASVPIAFTTTGTCPGGLNCSGSVVYYVCGAGITTNTFKLSSTKALAISNTCDINTTTTGTGTLTVWTGVMGGLDPGDPLGALQGNTDYELFLVANKGAPPNNWGLVLSCKSGAGCGSPTSGPSSTITSVYPYYMPIMWLRTDAGATTLEYITSKYDYHWSIANNQTQIAAASGIGAQWSSLSFAGLTDPNTAQY